VALCGGCRRQLGWRYGDPRAQPGFFGLIAPLLTTRR
jgi:hypothetical protein